MATLAELGEVSKGLNPLKAVRAAGKRARPAPARPETPKMTDWVQRDPFGRPVVHQPYKVPQEKMFVVQPREMTAGYKDTHREAFAPKRRTSRSSAGGDNYWNNFGGS